MSVPLGQRKKIQLIRGAAKRGLRPFLQQTYLCLADSGLRQRHLIFRLDADKVRTMPDTASSGLSFREVKSWEDLPRAAQTKLTDPQEQIDWGERSWFDRGWRLWIAQRGDQLAALGWWRSAAQTQDFFCPLPEGCEVLWHSTVMPELQGRGLQVPLRLSLMQARAAEGITAFFTNCRDYNTPSRRNIQHMGFQCIGVYTVDKITGRRSYRPLPAGTGAV